MEPNRGGGGIPEKVGRRRDFPDGSRWNEAQGVIRQAVSGPFREVGGEQNRSARPCELEGIGKERGKVSFHAEGFAGTPTAESRRIENDGVERLPALGEAAEVGRHILGDESVRFERKVVEFKIPPTALKKGFRNIHAGGYSADTRGGDGKCAGVGKGIKNATGLEFSKIGPVRALIAEEAGIVAGVEIDLEAEGVFLSDLSGRGGCIAFEQDGGVLFAGGANQLTAKNARGLPVGFL
jgi:hypothetical protein